MKELISLYNNFLIYYPNIFFILLFVIGVILINRVTVIIIKERTNNAKLGKIKKKDRKKINVIKNIFVILELLFLYMGIKIEKIIKRIGEKILIDK